MDIDKIINLRAQLAQSGGIQSLKISGDLYEAIQDFLNTPVCPLCKAELNIKDKYPGKSHIKSGIDGIKCHDCFIHRHIFVNFVFRKDLKNEKVIKFPEK